MISWHWCSHGFWIRVFGYGISVSKSKPLFSERYGYTRVLRIGPYSIKWLPKR